MGDAALIRTATHTSTMRGRSWPDAFLADWAAAFTDTGMALDEHARNGTLRRGLRAVLAHHILFRWNRLDLSYRRQGVLARVAKAVILDQ